MENCPVCGDGLTPGKPVCKVCDTELTVILEMKGFADTLQQLADQSRANGRTDRADLYEKLIHDVSQEKNTDLPRDDSEDLSPSDPEETHPAKVGRLLKEAGRKMNDLIGRQKTEAAERSEESEE